MPHNTSSDKVFFDANIVLESLLNRKFKPQTDKLIKATPARYISALSAHLVMYFGIKVYNKQILNQFLNDFVILPLTQDEFIKAQKDSYADFEDALQMATAINNSCNRFYTLDKKMRTHYKNQTDTRVILID